MNQKNTIIHYYILVESLCRQVFSNYDIDPTGLTGPCLLGEGFQLPVPS